MTDSPLFIHLRLHSIYSLLEGAMAIKALPKLAADQGMPAVGVTDSNNLFGALEFSETAAKGGVQPLIGCQLDLAYLPAPRPGDRAGDPAPVVCIAQSEAGYMNLFDYTESNENGSVDAQSEALYLAVLGKASSTTGELFYKLGVARVDVSATLSCGTDAVPATCGYDEGLAAGLVGLGFDYYVSQNAMIRFEYTYLGGEDSFSTNMLNLGLRYNFN